MNLSITEILAIIAIGLVLFGGKLPDVAKNLGVTLKEFKEGMQNPGEPEDDNDDEPERTIDQDDTLADEDTGDKT